MRIFQSFADLLNVVQFFRKLDRFSIVDYRPQVLPGQVFQYNLRLPSRLALIVNRCNIFVGELCSGLRFTKKAFFSFAFGKKCFSNYLYGNISLQEWIKRFINGAHASFADGRPNFIFANFLHFNRGLIPKNYLRPSTSDSTAVGSAKVDVSPRLLISASAIFLRIRRMIFPERVFGGARVN